MRALTHAEALAELARIGPIYDAACRYIDVLQEAGPLGYPNDPRQRNDFHELLHRVNGAQRGVLPLHPDPNKARDNHRRHADTDWAAIAPAHTSPEQPAAASRTSRTK